MVSSSPPRWLKSYYGKDFDTLKPVVVREGINYAIVRLNRVAPNGFSGIGYVLISKRGHHAGSDTIVLHEGVASTEDMEVMIRALKQHEGQA